MLQWGRNFAVAETRMRRGMREDRDRFNGAATLQLRKHIRGTDKGGAGDPASMGPQLCSCGNRPGFFTFYSSSNSLQWGRNFAVAETTGGGAGAATC